MEFSARQTTILAILVLFLGRVLNKRIASFQHYNIPEPVTGGITVSLVFASLYFLFDFSASFELVQRDALLIVFFTCVGLSSRFSTLLQGGKTLAILLVLAISYLFLQNLTGIGVTSVTELPSQVGVLSGSVSLSGGHGTAIAWSPIFIEKYGIANAAEIGIACATFGLVLGGVIGGPIAGWLIRKHQLTSSHSEAISVGVQDEGHQKVTVDSILTCLLVLAVAVGIGIHLHAFLLTLGLQLPIFVPCIFGGILLTNTIPFIWPKMDWPTGKPTLALTSEVCLGLFLAMSLMSLQLWTLIDLALPIILLTYRSSCRGELVCNFYCLSIARPKLRCRCDGLGLCGVGFRRHTNSHCQHDGGHQTIWCLANSVYRDPSGRCFLY